MISVIAFILFILNQCTVESDYLNKEPTIFVALFARNKEVTLPYFLTLLQNQDYPKDRISLWIQTDHNKDKTLEIIETWIAVVEKSYHFVSVNIDNSTEKFPDENGPAHWSVERFKHMINLREEALHTARKVWADFIFVGSFMFDLLNQKIFKTCYT